MNIDQLMKDAAARMKAFDDEVYASQLAFAAGRDKFIEHFSRKVEDARQRIENEYKRISEEIEGDGPGEVPGA